MGARPLARTLARPLAGSIADRDHVWRLVSESTDLIGYNLDNSLETFTRASSAHDRSGAVFGSNTPRTESLFGIRLIDMEPAATRINHDDVVDEWSRYRLDGATVTGGAPGGNADSYTLTRNSTTQSAYAQRFNCGYTSGQRYTARAIIKAGSNSKRFGLRIQSTWPARVDAVFDVTDGTVYGQNQSSWTGVASQMNALGDSWYEVILSGVSDETIADGRLSCGPSHRDSVTSWEAADTNLSDIYVAMVQVESGSVATSFVASAGAGETRSADALELDLSGISGGGITGTGTLLIVAAPSFDDNLDTDNANLIREATPSTPSELEISTGLTSEDNHANCYRSDGATAAGGGASLPGLWARNLRRVLVARFDPGSLVQLTVDHDAATLVNDTSGVPDPFATVSAVDIGVGFAGRIGAVYWPRLLTDAEEAALAAALGE